MTINATRLTAAAAILLLASTATNAQGTVTIFGVVDAQITRGSGSISSVTGLGSGGLQGSRLGFRGAEDLGGGLRAFFQVEHGLLVDTGMPQFTEFWGRNTYIGLSGPWGSVRLGRDNPPTFVIQSTYDPFLANGSATTRTFVGSLEQQQVIKARANNSIGYRSPEGSGGLGVHLMYALPEGATTGRYAGMRLSLKRGPFSIDSSVAKYGNAAIGDLDVFNVGASYDFGALSISGIFDRARSGTSDSTKAYMVAGTYGAGPWQWKLAWSQSDRRSSADAPQGKTGMLVGGFAYSLSKRTALYLHQAFLSNDDGAAVALGGARTAANGSARYTEMGIRHSF